MRHRDAGYALLGGAGLEIGAMSGPAKLPDGAVVSYCDVLDKAEAIRRFPELAPEALVDVDHIIDLNTEGLGKFAASSQDFAIANHVIAHVANPIRFLAELFRVVRQGGHVVISTGDRAHTFDRSRAETAFEHVLAEYRGGSTQLTDDHYLDFLAGVHPEVFALAVPDIIAVLGRVRARRETAHVWSSEGFRDFLRQAMELLEIDAECVYERNGEETGYEYFSVWRALGGSAGGDRAGTAVAAGPQAGTGPGPGPGPGSPESGGAAAAGRTMLLCGMHRSGTSVLARCLGSVGIWLGEDDDMLPAHAVDNPEGYWERRDIHDAHVAFLAASGHDWDRLAGLQAVDPSTPAAGRLQERLSEVLRRTSGHPVRAFKDPRLCLVLPVWGRVDPDFIPIVAVRHPLEIAASLLRTPRGIYPTSFSLLLWEKYLLRCLKDLGGRRALFVCYRKLLSSPVEEMQRVVSVLERQGIKGLRHPDPSALASIVKQGMRRNRQEADEAGVLTRGQSDLLKLLLEACEKDRMVAIGADDLAEPDVELAAFEAAFDSRVERATQRVAAEGEVRPELADLVAAKIHDVRLAVHLDNVRLRRRVDSLKLAGSDLRRRLDEAQERTSDERLKLERTVVELRRHIEGLKAGMASYASSVSWKVTAPLRWFASLLQPKGGLEQQLYRLYYRLPFMDAERKRRLIAWLHEHLPWLTRRTVSYAIYQAGRGAGIPGRTVPLAPRMDAARAAAMIAGFPEQPRVSIVMPTWNSDPAWLQNAYDSLVAQYYPHWQLCIADDASARKETLAWLRSVDDSRVRIVFLERNRGISGASNAALELADGDFVGLLDHDDVLAADALLESVRELVETGCDIVYSDEDKIDAGGRHFDPNFKPGYSSDMLLSQNYICHFLVVRRSLLQEVGGFRPGFEGSQDHDLLLRLSERSERIRRIPKVLYHWRMHAGSTAADPGAKPESWRSGLRAVEEAIQRRGIQGTVEFGRFPHTYRVRRSILGSPLVSIIVPFRDKPELLDTCVRSVLRSTSYRNFEVLCVDNGSRERETHLLMERLLDLDRRVRILEYAQPFNYSAINNFAVGHASGQHLLFLNNDTEVVDEQWLEAMLEHSQRPEVGIVGARLLYGDNTVQHAGVIAGLGGVAGHAHLNIRADSPGYFSRAHLIQELSAVTFACAMSRRDVFDRLGGLNENELQIAFNDVDYCFRARELGYRVIFTPFAVLHHYESKSRGYEDSPEKQARFAREIRYMQSRHEALIRDGDPFYNPNFLVDCESFSYPRNYFQALP